MPLVRRDPPDDPELRSLLEDPEACLQLEAESR
jgi:hypothetical protein